MDEPKPGISWEVFFHYAEEQCHLYGVCFVWRTAEGELLALHTPDVTVQRVGAGPVTGYRVRGVGSNGEPVHVRMQAGEVLAVRLGDDVLAKVRHWARGQAQ
jgi:hypothetical protein